MERRKGKVLVVWFFCALLAALPALWIPTNSSADPGHANTNGKHHHRGHGVMAELRKLNLTDAQKQEIASILKDKRDEAKTLATQMADARKNLFTVMSSPEYNDAAVQQAAQQIAQVHEQMIVLRAQIFHQVQGILTPEQQTKLAAMRARFGEKMQDRIEHRFDRLDKWIDAHSN